MSPTRPRLTTRTAVTNRNPISTHKKYDTLAGASGLRWIPRNMSGREMSRMDWLMVTITTPSVARQSAVRFWDIAIRSTLSAPRTSTDHQRAHSCWSRTDLLIPRRVGPSRYESVNLRETSHRLEPKYP